MSDLSARARQILDAGRRGEDPTPRDRERVRKALLQSLAASAVLGTPGVVKGLWTAGVSVKAWAIVAATTVLTGSAVVGTLWHVKSQARQHAVVRSQISTVVAPVPTVSSPAPTSKKERTAAMQPPAPRAVAKAPDKDTLVEETEALRQANQALQTGQAGRALELLDEQTLRFANGQLNEERAAARLLALCRLGRKQDAVADFAEFSRDHPQSPLLPRVRKACAEAVEP